MYLQGKNEFIHEYISLELPSDSISIITSNMGSSMCEVQIFGVGTLPESVQVWDVPYKDADMLLLSTHADDEHLFFGGTMPYYAGELNYKVQVAYLTNHWAEPYRPHELLNGLWTVGIKAYPVIGEFVDYYSDSLAHAKTLYDLDKVFAYEVELLRRFKPEVVIGHDINGEYGHGVHMLNTWVLQQAIQLSSDETYLPEQVARYGTFAVSKVYLHLYSENAVLMNWNIPLKTFDGKTAFEMAELGFAKHISQQEWFSVSTEGVYDCRAFGLYYTAVGDDQAEGNPDFFENVTTFSDDSVNEPLDEIAITQNEEDQEEQIQQEGFFDTDFFDDPEIKIAVILTGFLFLIFLLLVIWGRRRNRK
jgi:LmbE family N-acetylglucosaminyl deacetylase